MRKTLALATMLAACLSLPNAQAQTASLDNKGLEAAQVGSNQGSLEAIEPSGSDDKATPGVSQVRIVRLSEIRGAAQLDRNTGRGFEAAFANIPITTDARLRTQTGLAEVEFEDNSTLRLAPDTTVTFTELSRTAAGATITRINVAAGTVYTSLTKAKGNTFELATGTNVLELSPGAHVRLNAPGTAANETGALAVIDGSVQLERRMPGGALATLTTVEKHKSLELAPGISSSSSQAALPAFSQIQDEPFDEWDKNETDYQKHFAKAAFSGGTGYMFGASDLDYYGSFSNFGPCGRLWRPYFTSAAWGPYDNGVWAWYGGAGYSWVSPYPWGWLPFHSGSWVNCPTGGWGWRPGGVWQGLGNAPRPVRPVGIRPIGPGNPTQHPPKCPRPPLPPSPGRPTLVASSMRPLPVSGVTAEGTWTFRRDSAGFGVPRETFGSLSHVSRSVEHHGFASRSVETAYMGPPPSARETERSAANGSAVTRSAWAANHGANIPRSGDAAHQGTMAGQSANSQGTHTWNNGAGGGGRNGGFSAGSAGYSHGGWGGGGGSYSGSSGGSRGTWSGSSGGSSGGHMGGAAPAPSAPAASAPAASSGSHK